ERPSNIDELHEMFKTLLADRFKLQFHKETKEMSAYVLTIDKSGLKMKVNDSAETFEIPIQTQPIPGGMVKMVGTRVPTSYLVYFLANILNPPVVDQTNLTGNYDFTMNMDFRQLAPNRDGTPSTEPSEGPSLFTALREQLGLKLESHKAPVEIFVIDRAEK